VFENQAKRNVDFIVSRYRALHRQACQAITTESKQHFHGQSIRSFHSRPTIHLLHIVSLIFLLTFRSSEYVSNL